MGKTTGKEKHLHQRPFFNQFTPLRKAWTKYNSNAKLINIISLFLVALLRFCFRRTTWKAKLSEFFTSNKPFGGYFQSKACTYFQKICRWTRFTDAKLTKNITGSLVALPRFCLRKTIWKAKFSDIFFTSKKHFGGWFRWNSCTYLQKTFCWTKFNDANLIKKNSKFLVAPLHFFVRKTTWKGNFSEFFLALKNLLVASFMKAHGPTFREYVAEQVCRHQINQKHFKHFRRTPPFWF